MRVEVWFQDEARIGQKNTLTRVWGQTGSRPAAPNDLSFAWAYVFGAVCPSQGEAAALIMPICNTVAMNHHLCEISSYMKDFLFRPEQARTPVGVLSGGERARLTLARAFARRSNLLVLDEPTNDLDLETLDLLQEQLAEHHGTVLLVSHDRRFPRPRGDVHHRHRRQRPLGRVCRRLHRHAGAAGRGIAGFAAAKEAKHQTIPTGDANQRITGQPSPPNEFQ